MLHLTKEEERRMTAMATMKEKMRAFVEARGARCLTDALCVNFLDDVQAFTHEGAAKFVLVILIRKGYAERIVRLVENHHPVKEAAERILDALYGQLGFRKDVARLVVNAVLYALKQPELEGGAMTDNRQPIPPQPEDDEHIVFSGISLSRSMEEIARHMEGRGFARKGKTDFQIQMEGSFCEIENSTLYVNGSNSGLTKSIVLQFHPTYAAQYFEWSKTLFNLLVGKYGTPAYKEDTWNLITRDWTFYYDNFAWFEGKKGTWYTHYCYKWNVRGGEIQLTWIEDMVMLSYGDEKNEAAAKAYQNQLNQASI